MAAEINAPSAVENRPISDDSLYEVVDGRIVVLPPMGTDEEITAGILHARLASHVDGTKRGRAVVETLFDFTHLVGRKRRPDVAFVSSDRWPRTKPVGTPDGWPVVPNLAIEVVSRSNSWNDVLDKVHEYFQVGVVRVWIISTSKKQVHVFSSPTKVHILGHDDELTDPDQLPGFKLPLGELFEMVE